LAAWLVKYSRWNGEYGGVDYFEHHDGDGMGFVQDEPIWEIQVLPRMHDSAGADVRRD
jgi:hypothetical protein